MRIVHVLIRCGLVGLCLAALPGCDDDAGEPRQDAGADTAASDTAEPTDPPTADGDDASPTDTDPADDTDTAEVAMIDTALGCSPRPPASPPAGLIPGDDLHRVTFDLAAYPEALCNDGTPAVMYVRPATSEAARGEWVFHLQGGGSCGGVHARCIERWCGDGTYDAAKMSSRFAPLTTGGKGIFAPSSATASNAFAEANHVFVYYCSSDSWAGTASDTVLQPADGASDGPYRLHFRGHSIIEAVFDALEGGAVASDDGAVTMPALGTAQRVLWSGTSAGATGATQHLDHVRERLDPGIEVYGVIDANFPPETSLYTNQAVVDGMTGGLQAFWDTIYPQAYGGAFVDASCRAMLEGTADAWRCADHSYVLRNHVTTPYFARMDLGDSVVSKSALSFGATLAEFGTATHATLASTRDMRTDATEGSALTRLPGIYAPACTQHVGLTLNGWFFNATLEDDAATAWTCHDALVDWLAGNDVFILDTLPPSRSMCGPVTDDKS